MASASTSELARAQRRHRQHVVIFVLAFTLAAAACYAVHLDATGALPGGILGSVIIALEVVFIAGIIPLAVTTVYAGATLLAGMLAIRRERRAVPPARARAG